MSTHNSTIATLQRAIVIAEQIQKLESELAAILGGSAPSSPAKSKQAAAKPAKKGKRTLSPEARARIAAAQKARWAKVKGEAPAIATEKKTAAKVKVRRKISAEARAKMAAAAKRRWANVKK